MTQTQRIAGTLMIAAVMFASAAGAQEDDVEGEASVAAEQDDLGSNFGPGGMFQGLGFKMRSFVSRAMSVLGRTRIELGARPPRGERTAGDGAGQALERRQRDHAPGAEPGQAGQAPEGRGRGLERGEDGRPAHAVARGHERAASEAGDDASAAENHERRPAAGAGEHGARGPGRHGAAAGASPQGDAEGAAASGPRARGRHAQPAQ